MINSAAPRAGSSRRASGRVWRVCHRVRRVNLRSPPAASLWRKKRRGSAERVSSGGWKKEERGGPDAQIRAPDPWRRPV